MLAAELDAGAGADLDACRATLRDIRAELIRLRAQKLLLTGERADATATLIDAGQTFLDGAAARLLAKAEEGDADAAARLKRAARNILAALRGEDPVADATSNVTQTAAAIAADTRAAAAGAASAAPWVLGAVLVVAIGWVVMQRRAFGAVVGG
jgi:hypothetical protein